MTTVFEEEIRSQGDVLRRRAERGLQQARETAAWRDVNYAFVAARGSSDNAAAFFQNLAGRELGLVVALGVTVHESPASSQGASTIGKNSRHGPTASRYCLPIVLAIWSRWFRS